MKSWDFATVSVRHNGLFQCCRNNNEFFLIFSSVAIESWGTRLIAKEITQRIHSSYIILINTHQNHCFYPSKEIRNFSYYTVCWGIMSDNNIRIRILIPQLQVAKYLEWIVHDWNKQKIMKEMMLIMHCILFDAFVGILINLL